MNNATTLDLQSSRHRLSRYQPIELEPLTPEAGAVTAVQEIAERDSFTFRSVTCQRRMGADYCSVCFDHLKNYLGAALVRCRGVECEHMLDGGEIERIGWNPEIACGKLE